MTVNRCVSCHASVGPAPGWHDCANTAEKLVERLEAQLAAAEIYRAKHESCDLADALDEIAMLKVEARLAAVVALHHVHPDSPDRTTCWECEHEMPCPTVRAAGGK